MDNEVLEIAGVRFLNLTKFSNREQRRIYKLNYGHAIPTKHGPFVKVMDYKFKSISSRAGYAFVHLDDAEKYHSFAGDFDDFWNKHMLSLTTE